MSTPTAIVQAFNANADGYDRHLEPIITIKHALHALLRSHFAALPAVAHVLVVGAGTGAEARYLAPLFPGWRFTLVDPSEAMLGVARRHADAEGFADRCTFHAGFVSSVPADGFDAATSVLVSHFIPVAGDRQAYFADIARRLSPGGLLFNADLCAERTRGDFAAVMDLWLTLAATPDERREQFRAAFGRDFAVHGPAELEAMVAGAGFSPPVPVFQAALVRAWITTMAEESKRRVPLVAKTGV